MWIADNWKDYEVLDTSCGEKLERWGKYILVRPDPQVIWDTDKKAPPPGSAGHLEYKKRTERMEAFKWPLPQKQQRRWRMGVF